MTASLVALWILVFLLTIVIILIAPIIKLAKPLAIAILLELRMIWANMKEGSNGR